MLTLSPFSGCVNLCFLLIRYIQAFMESEGIVLNDPEPTPVDPYSKRCNIPQPCFKTPSEFDSMHQFLTMDRKVN